VTEPPQEHPYHHGDLRAALVEEAVRAIAEGGPSVLSLRDVARRVGVSHAAPKHHFGDKAGLLTAVAAEGFRLLGNELREAYDQSSDFVDLAVAYVDFALRRRPYFEVMFRPDLQRTADAELTEARERVQALLYASVSPPREASEEEGLIAFVAAWALVHGLATLMVSGNLPAALGTEPERLTRAVVRSLFSASRRED
jgi:AcrR family transcriptional regulator